jgi:hypothetical protein
VTTLPIKHTASLIRLFERVAKRDLHPDPKSAQPEYDLGDDLDEVVIGNWLHLEWMSEDHCWMRIGDAAVNVLFSAEGPVEVRISRGFYADIVGDTSVWNATDGD